MMYPWTMVFFRAELRRSRSLIIEQNKKANETASLFVVAPYGTNCACNLLKVYQTLLGCLN